MNDQDPNDTIDQEELVAYLDGELDAQHSRRVEQRLSEDPDYRSALQQLQRAWDLLDDLPTSQADESFTQSTVEMVAIQAVEDVASMKIKTQRRRGVLWALGGSGVVVGVLAGYLLVSAYLASPNKQLERDLPLIENVDNYRMVDSVEFLRQLESEGLFLEQGEVSDEAS